MSNIDALLVMFILTIFPFFLGVSKMIEIEDIQMNELLSSCDNCAIGVISHPYSTVFTASWLAFLVFVYTFTDEEAKKQEGAG